MRRILQSYGFDLAIVVVAMAGVVEVVAGRHAPDAPTMPLWLAAPAVAIMVSALLARRRFGFGAPTGVWLFGAAISFVDGRLVVFPTSVYAAGMAGAFLLGHRPSAAQARIGLALTVGSALVVVSNNPAHSAGQLIFTPLLFALMWLAGFGMQERAAQAEAANTRAEVAERERETAQREREVAEREREAAARVAVAEERARIARELHDVVAHAMSVMVLQVGAVRLRLPAPLTGEREALQGVEQAGRGALTEMRRLLGAMRRDDDEVDLVPQPGLGALDALVDRVGRAGLAVEVQIDGYPVALPPAIDLSAYRIIQEGLTNALKHAGSGRAEVRLEYGPADVTIEVRDDGRGSALVAPGGPSPGYGLVGIGERVKLYGGEMTTSTAAGGGFVLTTRLPLGR